MHREIKRGSLLVVTIMVVAALVFFSTAFLTVYLGNRSASSVHERDQVADNAALGGLERGMLALKNDSGLNASLGGQVPTTPSANVMQGSYSITFATPATDPVAPYSTNNIQGSAPNNKGWVPGMTLAQFNDPNFVGRIVPAGRAHLVSVGRCGNSVAVRECIMGMLPQHDGCLDVVGTV